MRSKLNFWIIGEIVDGNRPIGLHLQRLERLEMMVATNQIFEKNLLVFQRLGGLLQLSLIFIERIYY